MKKHTLMLALSSVVSLLASGCFTDRGVTGGGITAIPPQIDPSAPGVEYRTVEINGKIYSASRSKSSTWPGGTQERWDLVGQK